LFHIGMLWEHHSTGKEIVSTPFRVILGAVCVKQNNQWRVVRQAIDA